MVIRRVFGVDVNDIDMASVVKIFSDDSPVIGHGFSYVVTPNADHFQRFESEPNSIFAKSYLQAKFIFCDSRVIQKFALLKGCEIVNVIPGSDLTVALLSNGNFKQKKILMVGPTNEEVLKIADKFQLKDVASFTPPMGFIKNESLVRDAINAVANSSADYVFLAVGSPQQEILALKIKEHLDFYPISKRMVAFCIGASLDFLTGKQKRAPRVLQTLHLEWLHRALTSPRKLVPRYYRNFIWLCKILFTGK